MSKNRIAAVAALLLASTSIHSLTASAITREEYNAVARSVAAPGFAKVAEKIKLAEIVNATNAIITVNPAANVAQVFADIFIAENPTVVVGRAGVPVAGAADEAAAVVSMNTIIGGVGADSFAARLVDVNDNLGLEASMISAHAPNTEVPTNDTIKEIVTDKLTILP